MALGVTLNVLPLLGTESHGLDDGGGGGEKFAIVTPVKGRGRPPCSAVKVEVMLFWVSV